MKRLIGNNPNVVIITDEKRGFVKNINISNDELDMWLYKNNDNVSLEYAEIENGNAHLGYFYEEDESDFKDLLNEIDKELR